ncbi:hypothetical protein [Hymenobacter jejuensis]|uniref:Uncharacterized protein n=1 Tax=Hymenobacter jejuensis TaxID=2502781 RepID=A0A5B7ZV06_9BACT|nr:hypothetical protein [Hymenobacter jejuensis]QDA58961.1 hypothetical protein FHG12_02070 [Hymenobacter jejuensis]
MPASFQDFPSDNVSPTEANNLAAEPENHILPESVGHHSRRERLSGAAVATASKLLPLVKLLDAIQPHVAHESVFRTRRKKIQAHLALVYTELHSERPKREALTHAFQTLADLVREESRDISKDELKQAAKEVVLATLKNAPALINAAHQARLLS